MRGLGRITDLEVRATTELSVPPLVDDVMEEEAKPVHSKPVLLYDGQCGLCHRLVRTIFRLERRHELLFAPQQSEPGQRLLAGHSLPPEPDTVVFVQGAHVTFRSDAVLDTLRVMGGPWPFLARLGRLIPRPLREGAYRVVARHRLRFFGARSDACALPRPDQSKRFLV